MPNIDVTPMEQIVALQAILQRLQGQNIELEAKAIIFANKLTVAEAELAKVKAAQNGKIEEPIPAS